MPGWVVAWLYFVCPCVRCVWVLGAFVLRTGGYGVPAYGTVLAVSRAWGVLKEGGTPLSFINTPALIRSPRLPLSPLSARHLLLVLPVFPSLHARSNPFPPQPVRPPAYPPRRRIHPQLTSDHQTPICSFQNSIRHGAQLAFCTAGRTNCPPIWDQGRSSERSGVTPLIRCTTSDHSTKPPRAINDDPQHDRHSVKLSARASSRLSKTGDNCLS